MIVIKKSEKKDIDRIIVFEKELRRQEPDTYFWEPDEKYKRQLPKKADREK